MSQVTISLTYPLESKHTKIVTYLAPILQKTGDQIVRPVACTFKILFAATLKETIA